jgi:N-acetylmuramoyl-L-alanine amidase
VPRKSTEFIVIHCSKTPATEDIGVREIDRRHRAQGYFGCGYHYVIRRSGAVEEGRSIDAPGAHARGYNARSIGVCLIGGAAPDGSPENNFTSDQWQSLHVALDTLTRVYAGVKVVGHRDLDPKTTCPSFDVAAFLGTSTTEE